MKKYILLLIVISFGSSCSSLKRFGHEHRDVYKEITLENEIDSTAFRFDPSLKPAVRGLSCFDNELGTNGQNITLGYTLFNEPIHALNYFYKNKATWNIDKKIDRKENKLLMITDTEVKIKYELKSCFVMTYKGEIFVKGSELSSFRLLEP